MPNEPPYRSEIDALRAECERLRSENAALRRELSSPASARTIAGWVAVVAINMWGGIEARTLLNGARDRDVYLGAVLVVALVVMTLWQIARTFRTPRRSKGN